MDSWRYEAAAFSIAAVAETAKRMGVSEIGAKEVLEWKNAAEKLYALLPAAARAWLFDAGMEFLRNSADRVKDLLNYLSGRHPYLQRQQGAQ